MAEVSPQEGANQRAQLLEFYAKHNPAKLQDVNAIDETLRRYAGREDQLWKALFKKYNLDQEGNASEGYASAPANKNKDGFRRPEFQSKPGEHQDMSEAFSIIEGLKDLYKTSIRPLEEMYKFQEFHSPLMTDTDFDAKPMVLLIGQYSTGKTTFIRYLIESDFPGLRIGPEPTTDRFVAVMHGRDERVIPGNALAVQTDKPFTALTKYGMAFLNKFECAELSAPILQNMTFVDTPGILSGEKQRIGRSYDYAEVIEWFAERADRILLLFDAHKLDISDEMKTVLLALKGHDDKVRIVLNKADMVDNQSLMRIYGALMWSLGRVISTPEALRVYIGSFWDQPYKIKDNSRLFDSEQGDLLSDVRSLPRFSAIRKINELVKRARMAKVHAMIVSHLRDQFGFFGKKSKQETMMQNIEEEFRKVQAKYSLPSGDFPNPRRFRKIISRHDISKFPKLDPKFIASMDEVLGVHIPRLMRQMPGGHEKRNGGKGDLDDDLSGDSAAVEANPFDAPAPEQANGATGVSTGMIRGRGQEAWLITGAEKAKYDNIFYELGPVDGKVSGAQVRGVMEKSGLGTELLRQVWTLSDVDKDGYMDPGELSVCLYLCQFIKDGNAVPERLPSNLVPPNKRHLTGTF